MSRSTSGLGGERGMLLLAPAQDLFEQRPVSQAEIVLHVLDGLPLK
jgi:hypothetical protein